MVIGMIDKVEIWDQSILNDKDEHFNNEADNYEDLANEINF